MQLLQELLQQAYYELTQDYASAIKASDAAKKEYKKIKQESDFLTAKKSLSEDEKQRYDRLFTVARHTNDTLVTRCERQRIKLQLAKRQAKEQFLSFSNLLNELGLYDSQSKAIPNDEQIKQNIINAVKANNAYYFEALIKLLTLIPNDMQNEFDLGFYLNAITSAPIDSSYSLPVIATLRRNLDVLQILFSIDNVDIHGLDNDGQLNVVGAAFFNLKCDIENHGEFTQDALAVLNFVVQNGLAIGTYLIIDEKVLNEIASKGLFVNDHVIIGHIKPASFIEALKVNIQRLSLAKDYYPITNQLPAFKHAVTTKEALVNAITSGVINQHTVAIFQKAISNLITRLQFLEARYSEKNILQKPLMHPKDQYLPIEDLEAIKESITSLHTIKKYAQSFCKPSFWQDVEIRTRVDSGEKADKTHEEEPKTPSFYYTPSRPH